MHFEGLLIGAGALFVIGALHPVVIKAEYYFGTKPWPLFLAAGAAALCACVFIRQSVVSALLAVLGFSLFWGIHELFEQRERVRKGWFAQNPKRKD